MIVPGSIVIAIGLNPRYFAKINEKLLSTPPDSATTASVFQILQMYCFQNSGYNQSCRCFLI